MEDNSKTTNGIGDNSRTPSEEIITRYNGQYLKEAIENLSSKDVEIYLSSAQTAAVFKPVSKKENSDQTALLMPLRANADV